MRKVLNETKWISVLHCTGVGTGGTLDGNHFRLTEKIITETPMPATLNGVVDGSMIGPLRPNE